MNFRRICMGSKVGALSGFVASDNGTYLGLSAFHVLSGSNCEIDPFDDKVEVFNSETRRWLKLGRTIDGRYYKGDGSINNFGILDYAYFELFSSFTDRINYNLVETILSQYLFASDKTTLRNMRLVGYSVIDEKEIVGRITNVYYQAQNNRFDVEIDITDGNTHEGDSGMLWRDEYSLPLLMHIRGNAANYSTKSYCTFFDRIIGDRAFYSYDQRLSV